MEIEISQAVGGVAAYRVEGRLRRCHGLLLTCDGLERLATIGDTCVVERDRHTQDVSSEPLLAEVVGVDEGGTHLLPFDDLAGVAQGARVRLLAGYDRIRPDARWLGRVLDPLARPLDGAGPLARGARPYPLQARAVPAYRRRELGPRLDLGVRALNLFAPCCRGQRMGIFAGSGVGKSTLLAMLARYAEADALVLGLIGERGREVRAFLDDALGPEGRARSVVVVATSDMPAMLRRRAAYLTMAIAEALRDTGRNVLCMTDSVTSQVVGWNVVVFSGVRSIAVQHPRFPVHRLRVNGLVTRLGRPGPPGARPPGLQAGLRSAAPAGHRLRAPGLPRPTVLVEPQAPWTLDRGAGGPGCGGRRAWRCSRVGPAGPIGFLKACQADGRISADPETPGAAGAGAPSPARAGADRLAAPRPAAWRLSALLLGVGILVVGNGLAGTFLGVRASLAGMATESIGVLMSAFFPATS